jgi:hypothetical protein
MDSYLKQKVKKLVKSVMKNNKDVIEDLMDPNRTSEADLNSVATNRTSAILQRNEDEEECKCKGEKDCECDKVAPVDDEMEKAEEFIKSVIKNFKAISEAYIQKMEKSRMINDEEKRKLQYMKEAADYNQHQKKIKGTKLDYDHPQFGKDKKDKEETKTLESSEVEKKEGKPFHGYNKNKHSTKGGLSKKGREKINRETGSNLKAPVSSKAAKKSPKKAARRKSFCARMSGVKGPTSKKGKLTPKGAALKRWDC